MDDLLKALTRERYDHRWWATRPDVAADDQWRRPGSQADDPMWWDDEVTTARRRAVLDEAYGHEREAG